MGATFYLNEGSSSGITCSGLSFSLVCNYVSEIVRLNQDLAEDWDFHSRFTSGVDFNMVSLKACRNSSLITLSLELEKAFEPNHWFWAHAANMPRFQSVDWPLYNKGKRKAKLAQKLHKVGSPIFKKLREETVKCVKRSKAVRSQLDSKTHLIVLLNDFIHWTLRNEAAKQNTTVQHIAKQLSYQGKIIDPR